MYMFKKEQAIKHNQSRPNLDIVTIWKNLCSEKMKNWIRIMTQYNYRMFFFIITNSFMLSFYDSNGHHKSLSEI